MNNEPIKQIELSILKNDVLKIFNISDIKNLGDAIMACAINYDCKKYQSFSNAVSDDLNIDYLQMIYQYYIADRKNLKQDYTPKCLGNLLSQYANKTGCQKIIDICAGTGALTITQWAINKNIVVECEEIDEQVIPYLLFNLALRNIAGTVYHKDVLLNKTFETYELQRGEKYAHVYKQSAL